MRNRDKASALSAPETALQTVGGFPKAVFGVVGAAALAATALDAQVAAQDTSAIETAKPADSVSPYGVSFVSGSFTYSVPLFTIGNGEWPNTLSLSLSYDSSGNRLPNSPWTYSTSTRASGTFLSYFTGFEGEPFPEYHNYAANFVFGNSSQSFETGIDAIDPVNFKSASLDGSSLDYVPGTPGYHGGIFFEQYGEFTATSRTGNLLKTNGGLSNEELVFSGSPTINLANGNSVTYDTQTTIGSPATYEHTASGLLIYKEGVQTISSTVQQQEVCAYNLANIDLSQISDCSQSDTVATIVFEKFSDSYIYQATSITRADGGVYNFEYVRIEDLDGPNQYGGMILPPEVRYHLSCVKEPGQSTCAVSNTYDACDGPGVGSNGFDDMGWSGSRDRVTQQTLADGRVISYAYPGQSAPCRDVVSAVMTESGATSTVTLATQPGSQRPARVVASVTDPLQRITSYQWTGANSAAGYLGRNHQVSEVVFPEGNKRELTYDGRGNLTQARLVGKAGSGVADIVTSAVFTASCADAKTCNKPTSVTDANGNISSFTYSTDHGGVLTTVGPAVNGISPATKYAYVQRTPWLKSGSGYVAGDPIWLLSEERSCKATALNLVNGTCAGGASDLIVTSYDYGPNSGPNNLWLRGTAVTADGQTLRTCYSYDPLGRTISETQPNANLTSCP